MFKRKLLTALLLTLVFSSVSYAELMSITPMDSPKNLASTLVGDGIEITSVSYKGSTSSAGYFSGGKSTGIGLESGIVLTTGNVMNAEKANISGSTGNNMKQSGDSKLNSLIPGYKTYDASVLSVDFVSKGTSAYFNYAFASEEFVEWVGSSYNDVFGFHVDDENYALIPGTTTPVAINTVNQNTNSEFFNNNDPWKGGLDSPEYDLTYDGFTDVFTANIAGLIPGQTYTLEFAIADAGDGVYDSAVFIDAGSFSDAPVTPSGAPEPSLIILGALAVFILLGQKKGINFKKYLPHIRL
jgi:hypothetical protein